MLPRRGSLTQSRLGITVEGVLHPVGSLPPRVYWKRRAAGIVVVLLLAVVPFLLLGGRDPSEAAGAGATQPADPAGTPQLELVPAEPLDTSTTAPTTTAPTTTGQPPATSGPPATSPPPAAPVPCTDAMLGVTAGSQQPQYSAQDKPTLLMTVKNVVAQPCLRDLGTAQQEWGLFDGDARLWGSNDCLAEPAANVQTLQPGQQVVLRVVWSGLSSDRQCTEPRQRLAPGDYQLRARIGTAQSPNATLTLT